MKKIEIETEIEIEKVDVEQALAIDESSQTTVECAREDVVVARDEAIAQANSLEAECDRAIVVTLAKIEVGLGHVLSKKLALKQQLANSMV